VILQYLILCSVFPDTLKGEIAEHWKSRQQQQSVRHNSPGFENQDIHRVCVFYRDQFSWLIWGDGVRTINVIVGVDGECGIGGAEFELGGCA
jgi:hypothetical protein